MSQPLSHHGRILYLFVIVLVLVTGMVYIWRWVQPSDEVPPLTSPTSTISTIPPATTSSTNVVVTSTLPITQASSTEPVTTSTSMITGNVVCDATKSICVNVDALNKSFENALAVTGTAQVFENVVSWNVRDASGTVLGKGSTLAQPAATGVANPFAFKVWLLSAPTTTTGTLNVFEASAKDGQPIHVVSVPMQFSSKMTAVRIQLPKDMAQWTQLSYNIAQIGQGTAQRDALAWETHTVMIPFTSHPLEATTRVLLDTLHNINGPAMAYDLLYFSYASPHAYVTIRADVDGWAGVSAFQSVVTPIIEQNLKAVPGVKDVVRGTTSDGNMVSPDALPL